MTVLFLISLVYISSAAAAAGKHWEQRRLLLRESASFSGKSLARASSRFYLRHFFNRARTRPGAVGAQN